MNIVLVYNPKSGSALGPREIRKKCQQASIGVEKIIPMRQGFNRKLRKFIESESVIGVIGGDGTISAIAGMVTDTRAILAPLPGGTLNHFSKDLNIPQNMDEALARLSHAKVHQIDVGVVNEKVFINNSSLGLYPASLRSREELEKNVGKWPAAVVSAMRAFFRLKTYTVTIDKNTFRTPFVFVGNNIYQFGVGGGAVRKRLDEGVLSVLIARTQSRLTLLKIVLFTIAGRAKDLQEFDVFYPKRLTIHTKRKSLHVSHDGEVSKMESPIEYQIKKGVLRVL